MISLRRPAMKSRISRQTIAAGTGSSTGGTIYGGSDAGGITAIPIEPTSSFGGGIGDCPSLVPLLAGLNLLLTEVQVIIQTLVPVGGAISQFIAEMSAKSFVRPVIFVRLAWRQENLDADGKPPVFDFLRLDHRLAILDVYYRYDLTSYIMDDPLFYKDELGRQIATDLNLAAIAAREVEAPVAPLPRDPETGEVITEETAAARSRSTDVTAAPAATTATPAASGETTTVASGETTNATPVAAGETAATAVSAPVTTTPAIGVTVKNPFYQRNALRGDVPIPSDRPIVGKTITGAVTIGRAPIMINIFRKAPEPAPAPATE